MSTSGSNTTLLICAGADTTRRTPSTNCIPLPTAGQPTCRFQWTPGRMSPWCSRAIRCLRRPSGISCRSSARGRSTRTCSRTRQTASRNTCAPRAIATPSRAYTRSPRGGQLAVVFTVSKGAQFKVDKVQLTGATAIPEAELQAGLRTRVGELFIESSVDADVVGHRRGLPPPRVHGDEGHSRCPACGRRRRAGAGRRALRSGRGPARARRVDGRSTATTRCSDADLRAGIVTRDGPAVLPASTRHRS